MKNTLISGDTDGHDVGRMKLNFDSIRLIFLITLACTYLTSNAIYGQSKDHMYHIVGVGFYNLENLFDTEDSPYTQDTEFTPDGGNRYTDDVYQKKLSNLSRVISELGTDYHEDGLALLGVAEVENRSVLQDLVRQPPLRKRNYQIVHYDSPDHRGIDVGLIYNPSHFQLEMSDTYPMYFVEGNDTAYTRDILHVTGRLHGERTHILVNHWPSRSGGEKRTIHKRKAAARQCRKIYDELRAVDPKVRVIVMGDLNDDPVSPSVKDELRAVGKLDEVHAYEMYNPMWQPFRKGLGSNAWRDTWSLFDQVILSYGYANCNDGGFCYYKSVIYNPKYLRQKGGQYAGYPYRSYSSGQFIGGYSDHFPVFVYLARPIDQ